MKEVECKSEEGRRFGGDEIWLDVINLMVLVVLKEQLNQRYTSNNKTCHVKSCHLIVHHNYMMFITIIKMIPRNNAIPCLISLR